MFTGLLMIIVIYVYGVLGFFFFEDMFYDFNINGIDVYTPGERTCQDLSQCFLTVLNYVIGQTFED